MELTLPSMLFLRSLYNTRTWSQNWSNSGMTKSFRNTFTMKGKFNSITDLNWSKVSVMLSKEAEVLGLNLLSWLMMALNLGSVLGRIPVRSISYLRERKISDKMVKSLLFSYQSKYLFAHCLRIYVYTYLKERTDWSFIIFIPAEGK